MNNFDEAVERALAALRDAKTPEGMEARIVDRLALHAAVPDVAGFQWRDIFAGSALAGAWWRGAVSGVAVAMLVVGLVWMAGHRGRSNAGQVVVQERVVAAVPPALAVRDDVRSVPCASPGGVRVKGTAVRTSEGVRVVAKEVEVSHPGSRDGFDRAGAGAGAVGTEGRCEGAGLARPGDEGQG